MIYARKQFTFGMCHQVTRPSDQAASGPLQARPAPPSPVARHFSRANQDGTAGAGRRQESRMACNRFAS